MVPFSPQGLFFADPAPAARFLLMHDLRDRVHDLVVAAAAAGRTAGDLLYLRKSGFHLVKGLGAVEHLLNIRIRDLFALANQSVFHNAFPFHL